MRINRFVISFLLSGETLFVGVLLLKQFGAYSAETAYTETEFGQHIFTICKENESLRFNVSACMTWTTSEYSVANVPQERSQWKFHGLKYFMLLAQTVSFIIYFSVCGTLQIYYYINRRDRSGEWKCQPGKFLTPSKEMHEILIGSFNTFTANCSSAVLTCYLYNGGETMLYFNVSDYGWLYFIISLPLLFLYEEAAAYYLHRLMHRPFLYKHLHKWHHHYTIPTAFSATAFHPIEWWCFQTVHFLPAFVWPLHGLVFVTVLLYNYYYGLIDHSGVYIESVFPWQQPSLFHDYHHK